MDCRVVEKNRRDPRRNVLAFMDNSPRRLSGRCLTIAPNLRKSFSLNGFRRRPQSWASSLLGRDALSGTCYRTMLETPLFKSARYQELESVTCSFR